MTYSPDQVKDILIDFIQIRSIESIGCGNHSDAFCINNEIVVKLPKHQKASKCLETEMQVLRGLAHKTQVDIPNVLFDGTFSAGNQDFVFFASNRLRGKKLFKKDFLALDKKTLSANAEIIAKFLYHLHSVKQVLPIKRKDLVLLHGDFSLNHILFDDKNIVSGVLDFGDSRVGKPKSDFIYLLDDQDPEEFGANFGNMVLNIYERCKIEDNMNFKNE